MSCCPRLEGRRLLDGASFWSDENLLELERRLLDLVTALEDRGPVGVPHRPGLSSHPGSRVVSLLGATPQPKRLDQFFSSVTLVTRPPPLRDKGPACPVTPASFSPHHLQAAWAPPAPGVQSKVGAGRLNGRLSCPGCTTSQSVMEGKVVTGTLCL